MILLVPIAIEGWNRFLKSLGLIQKKTLQEKQREKEITEIYEKISCVQTDIVGKQAEYHAQSIEIRDGLAKDQAELRQKQKEIQADVKQMSDMLQDYNPEGRQKKRSLRSGQHCGSSIRVSWIRDMSRLTG